MHNGQFRRLSFNSAQHLLDKVEVETLPTEIAELQKLIDVKHPNLSQISQCISSNPEVLGSFLQLVNQVLKRPADDLILNTKSALHLMGLDELQRLFIGARLTKNLKQASVDPQFIQQSLRAALAATELSYWVYGITRTEAYLHGFLQDIGSSYMMHSDEMYSERFYHKQAAFPKSITSEEHLRYATHHGFVGALIIDKWNLGTSLCRTALFHHHPQPEQLARFDNKVSKIIALIQIANYLVFEVFSGKNVTKELDETYTQALDYLALPDNAIQSAISVLEKYGASEASNLTH